MEEEKKNIFDEMILLSRVSLDIVMLQQRLLKEVLEKLAKYEDVSEYKDLVNVRFDDAKEEGEKSEENSEEAEETKEEEKEDAE